ncbi:MAG: phosphoglucomutase/phosphomannomutase family protein [Saprospiraceae bacterium]|nr:phosphoglucomutase/phosphomannomutase family protein [Saprospiraceae bacterium]
MATKIKFGTDGWRAIIAQEYTVDNVMRVAEASAQWMKQNNHTDVVIGFDCRFAGELFARAACSVFSAHNLKVHLATNFVSTPMVSLGIVKLNAGLGVVITASHNPPSYNGFKLKASYGGPSIPKEVAEVEDLIPESTVHEVKSMDALAADPNVTFVDLEDMYIQHIKANFDMPLLTSFQAQMAYDAMYGAGQNVMKSLFPDARHLHCDYNPSFLGTAPEPIDRNLRELSETIAADSSITFGIANDGDADRLGMYDEDGVFVDSHRLLLLLLTYLYEHKGIKEGRVSVSFSVTDKVVELAKQYGLETDVTKIGFKYIAEIMSQTPVLVGGEESGGIAVSGHIPERDGIWTGLLVMEYMAKTGKSIKELLEEIYAKVGRFDFYRDDLHIDPSLKERVIKACESGQFSQFGPYTIDRTVTIDGFKFYFTDGSWVMIRPSGTEPVLRVYCEAPDLQEVRKRLDTVKADLLAL